MSGMGFRGFNIEWIYLNIHYFLLFGGAFGLIAIAMSVAALVQGRSLKKRYHKMMMGQEGISLERLLDHQGALISEVQRRQRQTDTRLAGVEEKLQPAIVGVGMVRYNAFRETGSDLSFSLALLDRNLDGVVLTSLFGREESRCYGKPVQQGQSSYPLSEEEVEALEQAGSGICPRQKVKRA